MCVFVCMRVCVCVCETVSVCLCVQQGSGRVTWSGECVSGLWWGGSIVNCKYVEGVSFHIDGAWVTEHEH